MSTIEEETPPIQRFTVLTWQAGDGFHACIPALGATLPAADSLAACLTAARNFIELTVEDELGDLGVPSEVEVQAHVVEVDRRERPHLPPQLLAAVLTTAIGDVVATIGDDRELLAALLSTLTGLTVQLHDDSGSDLDELDDFEPLTWTEERFQHAVRELLNARLQTTRTPADERARVLALLEHAIADQLALARELSLDSF
jgi:hypothetical protein